MRNTFNIKYCIGIIFILFLSGSILLKVVVSYNVSELKPSIFEIKRIERKFGNIILSDKKDIFKLQNNVLKNIKHKSLNISKSLNVDYIINCSSGYCFDRSYLLQKILIYNKIPIRPVYLFYFENGEKVEFYDFFNPKVNSHSIFEFNWEGKWYVMRTNTLMTHFETLDEYLNNNIGVIFPNNVKYVRYLSNRNSKFINPWWIPDIYYFNSNDYN